MAAHDEANGAQKPKIPLSEATRTIGGLLAVGIGVAAVVIVAGAAVSKNTQVAATIAGSAIGVIGSMVGAFFGVKIGSDQTKDAMKATQAESVKKDRQAAKAQVYALYVPDGQAETVEQAAAVAAAAVVDPAHAHG